MPTRYQGVKFRSVGDPVLHLSNPPGVDAAIKDGLLTFAQRFGKKPVSTWPNGKLHTLEIADRIIVLEQGHIVATGSHAELVVSCPLYQRLHEAQNQRRCA